MACLRRTPTVRERLLAAALVVSLGAALTLTYAARVNSQSPVVAAPAADPVPVPASAPTFAGLRADQAQLLLAALADAESHGLDPEAFGKAEIDALVTSREPADRERGLALLQRAAVAYARAQHGLRSRQAALPSDWSIRPAAYDAEADFAFALSQDGLAQWLASLPPPFQRYRQLRTALGQYRAIAARGGWPAIDPGPSLKPGMTDPRVIQLRRRIAAENAPGAIDVTSPIYDPTLAAIVAHVQGRYGLDPDGVAGAGLLRALNAPVETRIGQITANMERWRWMPRAWPATRIEVNIAAAKLDVYDRNVAVTDMKVVVGAPDKKTPMLQSAIHSVVFNPPWNVPDSIATKEILPKGEGYLEQNGFSWVSDGAGGSRLQQKPGEGNSLGRIKFDFANPFGVYLHDTNAKTAFGRDARSISHGCVRVERPEDLAMMLLGADPQWREGRLAEVLSVEETIRAPLAQKVPLLLMYWTVFADKNGQINFRDDIYKWDRKLISLYDAVPNMASG